MCKITVSFTQYFWSFCLCLLCKRSYSYHKLFMEQICLFCVMLCTWLTLYQNFLECWHLWTFKTGTFLWASWMTMASTRKQKIPWDITSTNLFPKPNYLKSAYFINSIHLHSNWFFTCTKIPHSWWSIMSISEVSVAIGELWTQIGYVSYSPQTKPALNLNVFRVGN